MHPLRKARLDADLTVAALSRRSGVTDRTIYRVETSGEVPADLTVWRLSRALGQDPEQMLGLLRDHSLTRDSESDDSKAKASTPIAS